MSVAWGGAVLGAAVFTIWRVVLVIGRQHRLHHRRANKLFMKGYRAGFRAARAPARRTTVEATASRDLRPATVRRRAPMNAGEPRPPASVGPVPTGRGRHAG